MKDVAIAVIGPVTEKDIEKAGLIVSIIPNKATIDATVHETINDPAASGRGIEPQEI